MENKKLESFIENRMIKSYRIVNVDEEGIEGRTSEFRNTERLELIFPNGETLKIETYCSGSSEDTGIHIF